MVAQAVRILGLNGIKLRNLAHLAELVSTYIANVLMSGQTAEISPVMLTVQVDSSRDDFLNFDMEEGRFVVLDRVKVIAGGACCTPALT